jgi:hypothetical protein
VSRWQWASPKTAAADLQRHVDICQHCQYNPQPCHIGKYLHASWLKLANDAMDEIWHRRHRRG